jgi:putative DNA methylase
MSRYPKRLIEVDLPIKRISAHARREKSIRHGHISTLHIWWARRPLAACRAVICAALWPDPAHELCPQAFRDRAAAILTDFAERVLGKRKIEGPSLLDTCSPEGLARWEAISKVAVERVQAENDGGANENGTKGEERMENEGGMMKSTNDDVRSSCSLSPSTLRAALLDFIADFANWDNSTVPAYLETARALTQAAHEALGGAPGTRPLVVDPFAGGGSIPLEALRVGADAFASDLNPVAVLLNKVVLEYIPKYGQRLADEVRKSGAWIKEQAEKELAEFYPKDPDGATPIAYLWARTIRCEGAGCGAEVPLIRSLWLAKKANRSVALQLVPNHEAKRVDFRIIKKEGSGWVDQANSKSRIANPILDGTVKRGSATCPCCGYTTPVASVRTQLKARRGGAHDARLFAVVLSRSDEQGRFYRHPTAGDEDAVRRAAHELERQQVESGRDDDHHALSLVPDEPISPNELRRISVPIYGMERWGDLYSPRQALALAVLARLVREGRSRIQEASEVGFADAVTTCLALANGRQADATSSLGRWHLTGEKHAATFGRQAIGMVWDFSEVNALSEMTGGYPGALAWVVKVCEANATALNETGHVEQASATAHPLPNDSASAVVTDPPYYDAVPYAYLSDYFYVWMRRTLAETHPILFRDVGVPKDAEIVVDRPHQLSRSNKGIEFYERELQKAFAEARRVLRPDGVGTIVFASKTTSSWEAILKAVVDAGWIITGSWPIDTEMEARVSAQGQARLASSVHLVCRPREDASGAVKESVGEWRDVLGELPKKIHEWMPRLAQEGVVGADAIFACLGPALEVFSRYSRVEKASGEAATLREYLEHVWAAVSTEALSLIFRDADASGLEPDARLTAMWLWTLGGGKDAGNGNGKKNVTTEDAEGAEVETTEEDDDSPRSSASSAVKGYVLEFDAARKIAQGLGVHLEKSESIVEVKGETARLLPVAERAGHLFGTGARDGAPGGPRGRKKAKQRSLFDELGEAEAADAGWTEVKGPSPGTTVLDRLHQTMILFAAGRGELMKRFLVEDGVGKDPRFWKLAQSLTALYPKDSDERRWVEGVLARKKGLGL